ncbi:MAG: hypothetical protein HYU63_08705 [Armatimonadetes bacterium]|nr:hypothetical protein [Armatimonadota bacterium]
MQGLKIAAELMAVSARTAPKSKGEDFIEIKIIEGDDLLKLAQGMLEYGRKTGKFNFDRDGENVKNSSLVLLLGLKDAKTVGLNCGACGKKCSQIKPTKQAEFKGPQCSLRILDLGIALGSAVKMADLLNIDNRIMYRIGVAARKIKLIDADIVIGIPLSGTGKNIYFDRK